MEWFFIFNMFFSEVIVQSQSGTGKTCVFCLGALQTVKPSEREPQVGNIYYKLIN